MTCLIGLTCFLLSTLAALADVTRFPPPGTPTNFTATASGGSVALTWTASTYAVSYSLYRVTASGAEGTTPYRSGLTSTSYTDSGVTGGTTYYYTLRAVNADDVSSQATAEVSATPSASAPAAPLALEPVMHFFSASDGFKRHYISLLATLKPNGIRCWSEPSKCALLRPNKP